MAVVTGMTAEKITELTSDSVVGASIDEVTGVLTLQTRDGQNLSVGSVETEDGVRNAVDAAYPVGSIFMSVLATNPASQLGVGTWAAWGAGRMPVGVDPNQTEFDTVEETGGSKTHTLTLSQIPAHAHTGAPHTHNMYHDHADATMSFEFATDTTSGGGQQRITDIQNKTGGGGQNASAEINIPGLATDAQTGTATFTGSTGMTGGNPDTSTQPHNNLPPYITCYMWKRTA